MELAENARSFCVFSLGKTLGCELVKLPVCWWSQDVALTSAACLECPVCVVLNFVIWFSFAFLSFAPERMHSKRDIKNGIGFFVSRQKPLIFVRFLCPSGNPVQLLPESAQSFGFLFLFYFFFFYFFSILFSFLFFFFISFLFFSPLPIFPA